MRLTETVSLVGSGDARLSSKYDCNVYAVDAPEGTILVDTGAGESSGAILENARATLGSVTHALLTHAHADHSQGVHECQRRDIPVIASEATAGLAACGDETGLGLRSARADGVYPDEYTFDTFVPDRTFDPPATFTTAGRTFDSVQLRGHARDHVVYLTDGPDRTYCFAGDAIYPDGKISLLNVHGSSLADYRRDIDNLADCDREIDALLPGHGLPKLEEGSEAVDEVSRALSGMGTPSSRT